MFYIKDVGVRYTALIYCLSYTRFTSDPLATSSYHCAVRRLAVVVGLVWPVSEYGGWMRQQI